MTQGFEEARARRSWLERLGERIPGFRGFQDRELRRDVDKQLREHLAAEVARLIADLRRRAGAYTDAGQLGPLALFDRLERRLDGLAQAVRFADYGASGFFDAVRIGAAELDRLYEFDGRLVEALAALAGGLAAVPAPGAGDPRSALEQAAGAAAELAARWQRREEVVTGAVRGR